MPMPLRVLSTGKLATRGEFKAARTALASYFEKKYDAAMVETELKQLKRGGKS